jgi:hypothetical protein
MKRYFVAVLTVLVIAVIAVACYYIGWRAGSDTVNFGVRYTEILNAASAYSLDADIVDAIESSDDAKALCLINLRASTRINKVRACLADAECRHLVESELQKIAPELVNEGDLRVKYHSEGQSCP